MTPFLCQIYRFEGDTPLEVGGPFKGRLVWNGSQDLQDVSISIVNVTYNDSGVYECHVRREFEFTFFTPSVSVVKNITLKVTEEGASPLLPLCVCVRFSSVRPVYGPVALLKIDACKRPTARR